MAVLREVKYLNFQQQKEIPESAEKLFAENETFRKFVGNLELIVGWYNEVSRCGVVWWRAGTCAAYSNVPRAALKCQRLQDGDGPKCCPWRHHLGWALANTAQLGETALEVSTSFGVVLTSPHIASITL